MRGILIAAGVVLLVCGCAAGGAQAPYSVTIDTNPTGATLVRKRTGDVYVAPAAIGYKPESVNFDADGCLWPDGFTAYWPSGAVAATDDRIALCGPPGQPHRVTITRPADAPGIERDYHAAALRQQELQATQDRQGAVAGNLIGAFALGAAGAAISNAGRPAYHEPPPLRCTPGPVTGSAPTYTCR